ncbi:hypothetical protein ACFWX6_34660 [Amycolatopsis sp. NPDC059019]|uniref:hypothetical protein n=1 Tax=Amycolatopsis sp. NPDC059019 TaxID=3346702 RepID=UPI00366B5B1D
MPEKRVTVASKLGLHSTPAAADGTAAGAPNHVDRASASPSVPASDVAQAT